MIVPIAATDDARIRDYALVAQPRRLEAAGLFVAEGRLLVERLAAGTRFPIHSVLLTPTALGSLPALAALDAPVFVAAAPVLEGITGIDFHRGCLALGHREDTRHRRNTEAGKAGTEDTGVLQGRLLLALEGVGNPDNVGGLFRVAAAFGAGGVLLDPASGDPLYRKALRTSMGTALTVPFARAASLPGALNEYRHQAFRIVALTPDPDAPALREVAADPARRTIVLVGGEGPGLSGGALALADVRARIPMAPGVDSLNVTVAAGIGLAHFAETCQ